MHINLLDVRINIYSNNHILFLYVKIIKMVKNLMNQLFILRIFLIYFLYLLLLNDFGIYYALAINFPKFVKSL